MVLANYNRYLKKQSKILKKSVRDASKVVLVILLILPLIGLIGSIFNRPSSDPNEKEDPTTSVTAPTEDTTDTTDPEEITDPTEDVTGSTEDTDNGLLMFSSPGASLDGYTDDGASWEQFFTDSDANETVADASSAITIPFG